MELSTVSAKMIVYEAFIETDNRRRALWWYVHQSDETRAEFRNYLAAFEEFRELMNGAEPVQPASEVNTTEEKT